jgi:hypothetical protein
MFYIFDKSKAMKFIRTSFILCLLSSLLWSCKKQEDGSDCWETVFLNPSLLSSTPDTTDISTGDTATFSLGFYDVQSTQYRRTDLAISGAVYTYKFEFMKYCANDKVGDWISVPGLKFTSAVPGIFQLEFGSSQTRYVRVQ